MGRGRAKAKQAKVARQLKYQTSGTSIEELREELGAAQTPTVPPEEADGNPHDPYDGEDDDGPGSQEELAERFAGSDDDYGDSLEEGERSERP